MGRTVEPAPGFGDEVLEDFAAPSTRCVAGAELLLQELEDQDPDLEERCGLLADRYEVYALRIPGCPHLVMAVSMDTASPRPWRCFVHGLLSSRARPCEAGRKSTSNASTRAGSRPMAKKSFRSRVLDLRPDLAESRAAHETKRKLALALRALRKEKGLTQKDVETRSTLTQPMISRLEAPTGSLPNWDTVTRYVEACGGHMLVGFSARQFDERKFLKSDEEAGGKAISALAV